jgi:hypothetical protein
VGVWTHDDERSVEEWVMTEPTGHDVRREHRAVMQAVITELAERSAGLPVPEVVDDLERSLAARGLPRQPHNWVMAVAQEAANGHIYVESEEALRDAAELRHHPENPAG